MLYLCPRGTYWVAPKDAEHTNLLKTKLPFSQFSFSNVVKMLFFQCFKLLDEFLCHKSMVGNWICNFSWVWYIGEKNQYNTTIWGEKNQSATISVRKTSFMRNGVIFGDPCLKVKLVASLGMYNKNYMICACILTLYVGGTWFWLQLRWWNRSFSYNDIWIVNYMPKTCKNE